MQRKELTRERWFGRMNKPAGMVGSGVRGFHPPAISTFRSYCAPPEWRLDRLLKRKAEQGVKVYVIVYKEVTQTMSMSSHHTKTALEALHPNIACMRHPDHIGSKGLSVRSTSRPATHI